MKKFKTMFAKFTVLFPIIAFAQVPDSMVTQSNVHETICVRGYTKTVRPPVAVTNRIKRTMCREQGITNFRDYVLDHIIPLEAGGHPSDIGNFQLQSKEAGKFKDRLENKARRDICDGADLSEVQRRFVRE